MALAILDFGEEDVVGLGGDDVDFVKLGFVVAFQNLVAVRLEIVSDKRFGMIAFGGGGNFISFSIC